MSNKYTYQALIDAITSDLNSKAASVKFNVPASTIRQHRREPNLKIHAGRPSYLTTEQESYFVSLLQLLPEYGLEITKDLALQLAADYFLSLELNMEPGSKWLNSFIERHQKDVIWKKQEKLERARAEGFTEECRSGWFKTLKEVLMKYNLHDKPNQIFNADETGFSDKTKGQWVIVNSSCRHAFEGNGGTGKEYRTALICISAGGQVLPPLLLYAGKHLIDNWCKGGIEGTRYGVTQKGWMNTSMFEHWLEMIFIPSTMHLNRPLLLILDGHATHVSLKIINLLKSNHIICLILPSHSTHALQPLDVVVFNVVKQDWCKVVKNHLKDGHKTIKNTDFPRLIKKLFVDRAAFSPTRIVSSFSRAGIWPYDENAMRHKVANNVNLFSTTTSTTIQCAPTNILTPSLVSSISSVLPDSTLIPCSVASPSSPPDLNNNSSLKTTTNLDLFSSSSTSNPSDTSFLDNQPSTTSQSFPLDLTLSTSSNRKQLLTLSQKSNRSSKTSTAENINHPSTSTPILAVRRVVNTLLSQRCKQLENNPQARTTRGKRLATHTGLNITEDELILLKMKENEEKKRQQRSNSSQQSSTPSTSKSKRSTTNKRRGRPLQQKCGNKKKVQSNDTEIDTTIRSLQSVIDMTDSILNNDDNSMFD